MVLGELQGKGADDFLPFKRTKKGFEEVKEEERETVDDICAEDMWDFLNRLADDAEDALTMLNQVSEDKDEQEEIKELCDLVDLLGGEEAVRWMKVEYEDVLTPSKWIPTVWVCMK